MKIWPTGRGARRKRALLAALLGGALLAGAEALAPGVLPPEARDALLLLLGL